MSPQKIPLGNEATTYIDACIKDLKEFKYSFAEIEIDQPGAVERKKNAIVTDLGKIITNHDMEKQQIFRFDKHEQSESTKQVNEAYKKRVDEIGQVASEIVAAHTVTRDCVGVIDTFPVDYIGWDNKEMIKNRSKFLRKSVKDQAEQFKHTLILKNLKVLEDRKIIDSGSYDKCCEAIEKALLKRNKIIDEEELNKLAQYQPTPSLQKKRIRTPVKRAETGAIPDNLVVTPPIAKKVGDTSLNTDISTIAKSITSVDQTTTEPENEPERPVIDADNREHQEDQINSPTQQTKREWPVITVTGSRTWLKDTWVNPKSDVKQEKLLKAIQQFQQAMADNNHGEIKHHFEEVIKLANQHRSKVFTFGNTASTNQFIECLKKMDSEYIYKLKGALGLECNDASPKAFKAALEKRAKEIGVGARVLDSNMKPNSK